MLKWAAASQTVASFFKLIQQQIGREEAGILAGKVHLRLDKPKSDLHIASSYHNIKQEQFMLDTQKLFRVNEEEGELHMRGNDINPSPAWVYGIRYKDVRQFLEYCGGEG